MQLLSIACCDILFNDTASQEDLAAASALHDLTLRRATALCRLQAECLSQRRATEQIYPRN